MLAYLILADDQPLQLERLIRRIQHPDSDVYIHLNAHSGMKDFVSVASLSNVYFVSKRSSIKRDTYTVVQALLDSMEHIIEMNIQYSHINLISSTDYPLKSSEELHKFLRSHPGKCFMNSRLMDEIHSYSQKLSQRVDCFNFKVYKFPGRRFFQFLIYSSGFRKKLPYGMKPYGSSQAMTLTLEAVKYILVYLKLYRTVKMYFKLSYAPADFIFQTILENSSLRNTLVNNDLRISILSQEAKYLRTLPIVDKGIALNPHKFFVNMVNYPIDGTVLDHLDRIIKSV